MKKTTPPVHQYTASEWHDYSLLDSGGGRKLEDFGPYRLIRPEPRAVWKPAADPETWAAADAEFVLAAKGGGGKWKKRTDLPPRWEIAYRDFRIWAALENSRQIGLFPENAVQWDWIQEQVRSGDPTIKVLNLFGYTGLSSLAAARAGADVTHIDSSRRAITLAREDQALNGMEQAPIRWIIEDAVKFAEREVRRGNRYHGLILDPPKYGLGPKKERWSFFEGFDHLCKVLNDCLVENPRFVVVTAYALESSPDVLLPGMELLLNGHRGRLELGSLVAEEKSAGRKIEMSITARWQAKAGKK